jgi:hypothetical protein
MAFSEVSVSKMSTSHHQISCSGQPEESLFSKVFSRKKGTTYWWQSFSLCTTIRQLFEIPCSVVDFILQ